MWLSNETSVAELRAMGRLQSIVKSKLVNRAVQCGTNCLVGFVLPSHKSLRARLFVEGIRTSFMAKSGRKYSCDKNIFLQDAVFR